MPAAEQGEAVDVLVAPAGRHGADLPVVGDRGLNSLAGRLRGSVPPGVTHRSPCDVLVVRTTPGRRC
ncbi:universal stress protein [Nonomuraea sp. NPDC004297]